MTKYLWRVLEWGDDTVYTSVVINYCGTLTYRLFIFIATWAQSIMHFAALLSIVLYQILVVPVTHSAALGKKSDVNGNNLPVVNLLLDTSSFNVNAVYKHVFILSWSVIPSGGQLCFSIKHTKSSSVRIFAVHWWKIPHQPCRRLARCQRCKEPAAGFVRPKQERVSPLAPLQVPAAYKGQFFRLHYTL